MTTRKNTHCKRCKSPLRRSRERKADHPNTKLHAGYGHCHGCRNYLERHGTNLAPTDPHTLAGLNNYLARRHQRLTTGRHA